MIKRYLKHKISSAHRNKYKTLNTVYIYRQRILHNVNVYKNLNPKAHIITVLKSNAYGHGLRQVAEALNEADIEFVAVDGYFEANRIIDICRHRILVMGYVLPDNARLLNASRCSFVVQDINGLRALGKLKRHFNVHLELNTGMNRLGLEPDEIDGYLQEISKYPNLRLEGIMTHLADADNPDDSYTTMQTKIFDSLVKHIQEKGYTPSIIHIAQSAGSTKSLSSTANAVRIGIGLYGVNPLDSADPNYSKLESLLPVMELKSTIIKVLELSRGEKISYNGIFETKRKSRIGVLPLGYYEWVPRELSNSGVITTSKARPLPIRGRVCMNHTMVDLTGTDIKEGDQVIVVSADKALPNSIDSISKNHELFRYSLLTRMAESVRRELI